MPTGGEAHGLYPSRDASDLYVTNRTGHSVSVGPFATGRVVRHLADPGGGSPDMGGVTADGKRAVAVRPLRRRGLRAATRATGDLLAAHPGRAAGRTGSRVWPQPGRYSLGHTGVLR